MFPGTLAATGALHDAQASPGYSEAAFPGDPARLANLKSLAERAANRVVGGRNERVVGRSG